MRRRSGCQAGLASLIVILALSPSDGQAQMAPSCVAGPATDLPTCAGVLPANFESRPMLIALKSASAVLQQAAGAYRQTRCTESLPSKKRCPTDQFGTVFVNPDARKYDPAAIVSPILASALRFRAGTTRDRRYRATGDIPYVDGDPRFLYIVAMPLATPSADPTVVARWVGYVVRDRQVVSAGSGLLRRCTETHDADSAPTDPPNGWFTTCREDGRLSALSANLGVSQAAVLACVTQEWSRDSRAWMRTTAQCLVQAVRRAHGGKAVRVALTPQDLGMLWRTAYNASIGPAWFSCLAGCCTAENEMM